MGWVTVDSFGNVNQEPVLLDEETLLPDETDKCCLCNVEKSIEFFKEENDHKYCEDCHGTLIPCEECNTLCESPKCLKIDENGTTAFYCDDCFDDSCNTCYACHDHVHNDNTIIYGNESLCYNCYRDNYFTCDSCNHVYHNDEYHGNGFCTDCYTDEDEENEIDDLYEYNADPFGICFGSNAVVTKMKETPTAPFLGVELEVGILERIDTSVAVGIVNDLLGVKAITKKDSSINNGFEICTLPMLLEEHKEWEAWHKFFKEAPKFFYEDSSKRRCGMHVHINRAAFNRLTLTRFIAFIHGATNRDFIRSIAERESEDYCSLIDKTPWEHSGVEGKYQAVNLMKQKTIEVRIFASMVHTDHFYKNLEFVQALYEYCKGLPPVDILTNEHPKSNPALRANAFVEWLKDKNYQYLNTFIKKEIKTVCV